MKGFVLGLRFSSSPPLFWQKPLLNTLRGGFSCFWASKKCTKIAPNDQAGPISSCINSSCSTQRLKPINTKSTQIHSSKNQGQNRMILYGQPHQENTDCHKEKTSYAKTPYLLGAILGLVITYPMKFYGRKMKPLLFWHPPNPYGISQING